MGFNRSDINTNALKVTQRLSEGGFTAYLVGGCVRDLLLDRQPKDFDVATNATPQQVHRLFRNSRIIGRRFQIVHVRFGREIIEVSTFRAQHDQNQSSEAGHILNDNVFGSFEDDAVRRDFTINALYYCPGKDQVLDPTGLGLNDLQKKRLVLIGDPATRFREDPVRMLRAIRFKAKLDFSISQKLERTIQSKAALMAEIPPARLFEEVLKLLMAGRAKKTYQALKHYQLIETLFPNVADAGPNQTLIELALESTDRRIENGQPVTPAFLFAALLWDPVAQRHNQLIENDGLSRADGWVVAGDQIVAQQQSTLSIPRRFSGPAKDIWCLQDRFEARQGKRPFRMLAHKRFRAAYDFLLLRRDSGEPLGALCDWWTEFQTADDVQKQTMIDSARPNRKRKPKRKPKAK